MEETEIVKKIFIQYLSGNGYKVIAESLNNEGKKTKLDNRFNGNRIKDILKNPTYYGMIRWGYRSDSGKKIGGKTKRVYNDNPIIQKGKHEAIITEEVYNEVQQKINNNPRHHLKRFNGHHLLSGLLRCPYWVSSVCLFKESKIVKVEKLMNIMFVINIKPIRNV